MTGDAFADQHIALAIAAASRAIGEATNRRYYLDPDATSVRYSTPEMFRHLLIDDITQVVAIDIDRVGDGSFVENWVQNTQYVMEPLNAAAKLCPSPRARAGNSTADPPRHVDRTTVRGRWSGFDVRQHNRPEDTTRSAPNTRAARTPRCPVIRAFRTGRGVWPNVRDAWEPGTIRARLPLHTAISVRLGTSRGCE